MCILKYMDWQLAGWAKSWLGFKTESPPLASPVGASLVGREIKYIFSTYARLRENAECRFNATEW